jgi:hypothetical protein
MNRHPLTVLALSLLLNASRAVPSQGAPLPRPPDSLVRVVVTGNVTPAFVEVDLDGRVTRKQDVKGANCCALRLKNGNILVGVCNEGLAEYTPEGKVVWSSEGLPLRGWVFGLQELPNGNLLVAHFDGRRVIEINRQREIVWTYTNEARPHSAQRLDNGNTLVCLWSPGAVVEVTREGKTVWEVRGLSSPNEAVQLPNGHVLVAEFGNKRVVEFDRDGKEFWQRKFQGGPNSVRRLRDGRMIVSDWTEGVVLIDAEGQMVRQLFSAQNAGKVEITFARP